MGRKNDAGIRLTEMAEVAGKSVRHSGNVRNIDSVAQSLSIQSLANEKLKELASKLAEEKAALELQKIIDVRYLLDLMKTKGKVGIAGALYEDEVFTRRDLTIGLGYEILF